MRFCPGYVHGHAPSGAVATELAGGAPAPARRRPVAVLAGGGAYHDKLAGASNGEERNLILISGRPTAAPHSSYYMTNTSLIASSHFPLVAFTIATATACMVNCLCVAHAHVFVGCSNLSPQPVWVSPSPEWGPSVRSSADAHALAAMVASVSFDL